MDGKKTTRPRTARRLGAPALAGGLAVATAAAIMAQAAPAPASDATHSSAATRAAVNKRIAVVLVNFSDDAIDPSEAYRTKVRGMYFGTGSLAAYYNEASDKRVTFVPPAGGKQIFGPVTLDMAAKCDTGTMRTQARAKLAAAGLGDDAYDHLAIWFPNGKAKCGWGGLAQRPGTVSWMPQGGSVSGVVHELGHNLGFGHLNVVTCTAGTLTDCAKDGYRGSSPMGGGGYKSGLAPAELLHKGWVGSGQIVRSAGPGTYTLVPLHAGSGTGGTRILEIDRSGTARLLISFRRNGTTIDTGAGEGVQLHLTNAGDYDNSQLVDPSAGTTGKDDTDLNVGASVRDAQSGRTIKVIKVEAGAATVRVS